MMQARQGYVSGVRSLLSFWAVASVASILLGYGLGRPAVQPYLLDILLLMLAACFGFIAIAAIYIFMRRVKPVEKPAALFSLVAVTLFLVAIFFVGRWIAIADFNGADARGATASATRTR